MYHMEIRKILTSKHFLFFIATFFAYTVSSAQSPTNTNVKTQADATVKSQIKVKGNWSLYGAMTLNELSVDDAAVSAPVNYLYNSVNNNVLKTGYSVGLRYDGGLNKLWGYSLNFGFNSVNAGTLYKNKYTIPPFIEDFTHFKADNKFTTLSFATNFKYLLPLSDITNYKFYTVLGPSLDYKISNISKENLIDGAGNRAFVNFDLGFEFNNKDYYVLYIHNKIGKNLTNSTVPVVLERFELGLAFKMKDLF